MKFYNSEQDKRKQSARPEIKVKVNKAVFYKRRMISPNFRTERIEHAQ